MIVGWWWWLSVHVMPLFTCKKWLLMYAALAQARGWIGRELGDLWHRVG